jgi:FtsH-binding integral membrane protein
MDETNSKHRKEQKVRNLIGILIILAGGCVMGLAAGFIPFDSSSVQIPLWVMGTSGLVFMIGGAMVFVGMDNRYNEFFAFLLLFLMGSIVGWVSIFGDENDFFGGIPLLPDEVNIMAARLLFGIGALICLGLSFYAFQRFRKFKAASP